MSPVESSWDIAASSAADGGLLQSESWGRFQRALGRRVDFVRNQNLESGIVGGQTVVVEHPLPFGFSYAYSPRGPLVSEESRIQNLESRNGLNALAAEVRAKFPHAIFWRIEPPAPEFRIQNLEYRAVKAPRDVQPSTTLVVDLTKTESEILAGMKQKTRYNIGLAERRGVAVRSLEHSHDLTAFAQLLRTTAERDQFSLHPIQYYQTMFATLAPEHLELFIAEHDGVMLAAALVAFFGRWAYYLHGGSSSEHRDLMAPQLLHWEIMRTAKFRGFTHYDLWGIDEKRWPGVTRFKLGFAPNKEPTHYAGTWDVALRPWSYRAYRAALRFSSRVTSPF